MASTRNEVVYLDHEGLRRRYVVYRPENLPPAPAAVLMLDGRGGTPWTAMKITGWSKLADQEGFLAVYPEALRLDPEQPMHYLTNPQMWFAGTGGSDTDRSPVDDTDFLRAVLADLPRRTGADPGRLFLTGFSNGASMVFRFALTHPGQAAAIAPVSGHLRKRSSASAPVPPTPCRMIFGRMDPLSPFDGGRVELPWGATETRPSVLDSFRAWLAATGRPDANLTIETPAEGLTRWVMDGDPLTDLTVVEDLAHVWPGGHRLLPESLVGPGSNRLDGTREIWSFFQSVAADKGQNSAQL